MNNQRIAILAISLVGIIACFLPWAAMERGASFSGIEYSGWITFIIFLLTGILSLVGSRKKLMRGIFFYTTIILGLVAAAVGFWEIFELRSERAVAEYGLYLVMLCGIMIPVAAYLVGDKATGTGRRKHGSTFSHETEVNKKAAPD